MFFLSTHCIAQWTLEKYLSYSNNNLLSFFSLNPGVLQATTGEQFEKRYSPNFKIDESLRRQSSTKRKRDEVLRWEFINYNFLRMFNMHQPPICVYLHFFDLQARFLINTGLTNCLIDYNVLLLLNYWSII